MTSQLATRYAETFRDPVLAQFEMARKASGLSDSEISRRCGVSTACLRNWRREGKTRRPQHLTLVFAFRALGFRFNLEKI